MNLRDATVIIESNHQKMKWQSINVKRNSLGTKIGAHYWPLQERELLHHRLAMPCVLC